MIFRLIPCSSYRPSQELATKHREGNMAAGFPPVAVMEEVQPLERLTDTLTLGASLLELQEDPMVVQPQGAPMVSHLQIPTVAHLLGLMDRDLLRVSRDLGLQMPLTSVSAT